MPYFFAAVLLAIPFLTALTASVNFSLSYEGGFFLIGAI